MTIMRSMFTATMSAALVTVLACGGKDATPSDDSKVPAAAGKAAAAKASDAKTDTKTPTKADAKAPAKADAKAMAKSDVKAPPKTDAKTTAKSDAKAPAKAPATAPSKVASAPAKSAPAPSKSMASAPAKSAPAHDMSKMAGPSAAPSKAAMPAKDGSWPELDAFHKILADSWHPVESGDMKAARANAPALLDAALAWRKSRGPAKCDDASLRAGMTTMIEHARWYADAVKRDASDDAVKVTLKSTHEIFEQSAEKCMMGDAMMKKP